MKIKNIKKKKRVRTICMILLAATCSFVGVVPVPASNMEQVLTPFEKLMSPNSTENIKMAKAKQVETEPNDDVQSADEVKVGESIAGTIGFNDSVDIYKFTLKKTTYVNISLTHDVVAGLTGNMWFAYLRNDKGKILNKTTDHVFSVAERTYAESKALKLKKGTYYVTVVGHTLALGQQYQMTVNQIKADKPVIQAVNSTNYSSITLSWQAIPGAVHYKIYRSRKESGDYQHVATVKGAETTNWTDEKLSTGKKYYYKMKAVVTTDKNYTSSFSKVASGKPVPGTASLITFASNKNITLRWTEVSGANGYEIVRSTKVSGSYQTVKKIKKGTVTSYTDGKRKSGKTYYYKIRAYRIVNGKKIYGAYSNLAFGIVS